MTLLHRYPITIFYLLATLIALAVNLVVFPLFGEQLVQGVAEAKRALNLNSFSVTMIFHDFGQSWLPLGILFPLAPTIAALIVAACFAGSAGVTNLLSRLAPWRGVVTAKQGLSVYFALFLGGFGVLCTTIIVNRMFGGEADLSAVLELARLNSPGVAVSAFFFAAFTDMGAVNEELGWRGFAYPMLLERVGNPLLIAILLGVLWGLWHLPREILALLIGQKQLSAILIGQVSFLINAVSLTIIMLYFVNRTGGSVLPAIFVHGVSNYTGEMIHLIYVMNDSAVSGGYLFPFLESFSLIKLFIALAIVFVAGPQLGLDTPRRDAIVLPYLRGHWQKANEEAMRP